MSSQDDPRTEELGQLKLALATFALHLDAFEMQTLEVLHAVDKPGNGAPRVNTARKHRKDDVIGGQ